jgi:DNA-directed RNA polymerase subunit K/omega
MSDNDSNIDSESLFDSDNDDFSDDDITEDNTETDEDDNKEKVKDFNTRKKSIQEDSNVWETDTESTIYGGATETNDCVYDLLDDDEEDIVNMIRVPDNERITTKKLTKYERVRILGIRTKQIAMGAKVMLKYEGSDKTPEDLARLEIERKVCPILIKRTLPNNKYELWKLSELEIIN